MTAAELAYARRQAEVFGAQVRWISQRFGPWGLLVRGPHVPRGGGYGVVGEALTGLWRVATVEPRLAELQGPIGERAACVAGLAIAAEVDESDAGDYAAPDRVRGAWLRDGTTRMDDQQHAISALLRTEAIVAAQPDAPARGPAPSGWLWLLALGAAFNPFLAWAGLPRAGRTRRELGGIAALGGLIGGAGAAVVAVGAAWLLDVGRRQRPGGPARRRRGGGDRRRRRPHPATWRWPRTAGRSRPARPARSDRVAKYNQLLRLEADLGEAAAFRGRKALSAQRDGRCPRSAGSSCAESSGDRGRDEDADPQAAAAASDAGRSRLGDLTRPVAREQRIAKNRRPAFLLGAVGLSSPAPSAPPFSACRCARGSRRTTSSPA